MGGYVLAPAVAAIGAEAIAFTKNPVAYCTINPVSCVAVVDTAAGTAAGVPVTGVTIPHAVPKTSARVNTAEEIELFNNVPKSPVDIAHAIGAEYTKGGKPTGGHSLLNGDVRIVSGTESLPDASGVYKATIQLPDPQNPGQWITKTSNNSMNTMFPKHWDAATIQLEVDAAWNSKNKVINGNKWSSFTPSGVKVEGFISPRTTVYPVHQP